MFTRTSRAKRRIGAAVLAALVGSLLAFASPAGALAAAEATTESFAGTNRYDTAAKIALDEKWNAGAADIVVVNGENFPDGLAASALGNRILLTRADSIPTETSAAIAALKCTTCTPAGPGINSITVVGGTGVVSSAVMEALGVAAGKTPTRLSGADRYATALAVADSVDGAGVPGNIVLATGDNFPDALSAGPLALALGAPIVLTSGASLRADVSAYIATMAPAGTVYIIGGTGAVPASIVSDIQALGKNVTRISGADREATAVAVSAAIDTAAAGTGNKSAVLVNRNGFADALAAAPFAHQDNVNGSIMLVNTDAIPAATAAWHAAACGTLGAASAGGDAGKVYAAGGTGVVSAAVVAGAATATKCVPLTATATYTSTIATRATINVTTTDGAGVAAGNWAAATGPVLSAVAGSAADGLAGNGWTITFAGAAAATTADSAVVTGAKAMTVTINGDMTAMTQQQFVERFNAIPAAAALFTASARNATAAGVAPGANLVGAASSGATSTHVVTVTMSSPIGDDGAFATAPDLADFGLLAAGGGAAAFVGGAAVVTMSPIPNLADADGGTVFTLTVTGSTAAVAADDVMTIAAGDVATAGGNTTAAVNATLTAG